MTADHPELGPELKALAQTILERVDPFIRFAAARAAAGAERAGNCQQVWCPVCALAALAQGQQHPLLDVLAEHSVALLDLARALVDDAATPTTDPTPPSSPEPPPEPPQPEAPGRYQHIPVTVED